MVIWKGHLSVHPFQDKLTNFNKKFVNFLVAFKYITNWIAAVSVAAIFILRRMHHELLSEERIY